MATYQISSAALEDDGTCSYPYGTYWWNDGYNSAGSQTNANYKYHVFLRFPNFELPQGLVCTDARLTTYNNGKQGSFLGRIYGFDEDDSAQVVDKSDYGSRALTSAYVAFNGGSGTLTTNSLATVINEILARPDFVEGNALQLTHKCVSTAVSTYSRYDSYDDGTAPILVITYTPVVTNVYSWGMLIG